MTQPQLTDAQLAQIAATARFRRKLTRAAGYARFNGWMLGLFGIVSVLTGLGSPPELLLGLALAWVAFGEFRGSKRMLALDPRAPRELALNQISLGVAIVAYSGWRAWAAMTTEPELAAHAAELDTVLGPGGGESLARMSQMISVAAYGGAAVVAVVFQSLSAWYYASRSRIMRAYIAGTPSWVVEVDRALRAA